MNIFCPACGILQSPSSADEVTGNMACQQCGHRWNQVERAERPSGLRRRLHRDPDVWPIADIDLPLGVVMADDGANRAMTIHDDHDDGLMFASQPAASAQGSASDQGSIPNASIPDASIPVDSTPPVVDITTVQPDVDSEDYTPGNEVVGHRAEPLTQAKPSNRLPAMNTPRPVEAKSASGKLKALITPDQPLPPPPSFVAGSTETSDHHASSQTSLQTPAQQPPASGSSRHISSDNDFSFDVPEIEIGQDAIEVIDADQASADDATAGLDVFRQIEENIAHPEVGSAEQHNNSQQASPQHNNSQQENLQQASAQQSSPEQEITRKVVNGSSSRTGSFVAHSDDNQGDAAVAEDPLIGLVVNGHLIEDKVGEGGMGSVYRARQLSLDRIVAIKILPPELTRNNKFLRRFEQEAKSLARINHPNILHVYDFGTDHEHGLYFMVMEFVEGLDLSEMLHQQQTIEQSQALDIVRQTAIGLEHAFRKGVIHRDIKPDNLMITSDGVCKVADFGLAKDAAAAKVTNAGSRVGTPAFMSPEQCDGATIDHRSDMYSLGVTLYVALTGYLPFHADSPFAIMLKHKNDAVPSVLKRMPAVHPHVDELVKRLMQKDPADRFADYAAMLAEVERILAELDTPDFDSEELISAFKEDGADGSSDGWELGGGGAFDDVSSMPEVIPELSPAAAENDSNGTTNSGTGQHQRDDVLHQMSLAPKLQNGLAPVAREPTPAVPAGLSYPQDTVQNPELAPMSVSNPAPIESGSWYASPEESYDPSAASSAMLAVPDAGREPTSSHTSSSHTSTSHASRSDDSAASAAHPAQQRPSARRRNLNRITRRSEQFEQALEQAETAEQGRQWQDALAFWQEASQHCDDRVQRQGIQEHIDRMQVRVRRRRRVKRLAGLAVLLLLAVGTTFSGWPLWHKYRINQLYQGLPSASQDRRLALDQLIQQHGQPSAWYRQVFQRDYELPIIADLVAERDAMSVVDESAMLVAWLQQADVILAHEQDADMVWQELITITGDHLRQAPVVDATSADATSADATSDSTDLSSTRSKLEALLQRAQQRFAQQRERQRLINSALAQGDVPGGLALADEMRREPHLGQLAQELPVAQPLRITAGADVRVEIVIDGVVMRGQSEMAYRLPQRPVTIVAQAPGHTRAVLTVGPGSAAVGALELQLTPGITRLPGAVASAKPANPANPANPVLLRLGSPFEQAESAASDSAIVVRSGHSWLLANGQQSVWPDLEHASTWQLVGASGAQLFMIDGQSAVALDWREAISTSRPVPRSLPIPPATTMAVHAITGHGKDVFLVAEARDDGWALSRWAGQEQPQYYDVLGTTPTLPLWMGQYRNRLVIINDVEIILIDADGTWRGPLSLEGRRSGPVTWLDQRTLAVPLGNELLAVALGDVGEHPARLFSDDPLQFSDGPLTQAQSIATGSVLLSPDGAMRVLQYRRGWVESWRVNLAVANSPLRLLDAGKVILVGSGAVLRCFAAANGAELGGILHQRPVLAAIVADGHILVLDDAHEVTAYPLPTAK